jgi:hypothetical protein
MKAKPDALFNKASDDAAQWMSQARDEIDAVFGAGHAKGNPHLVAMFMRVAAMNYQTTTEAKLAAQRLDELSRLIDSLYNFRTKEFPLLLSVLSPARKPRSAKA